MPSRTLDEIALEWDAIASRRFEQIETRRDLSFHHVLLPVIDELLLEADLSRLLEVGCGSGFLADHLANAAGEVVAIDVSKENIRLAEKYHARTNVSFLSTSIQSLARRKTQPRFSATVANMTLMTIPDLHSAASAISSLIGANGLFVATITHPWFWPSYWGYASEPWFEYSREIMIEAPFAISLDKADALITTHIHRPLGMYWEAMAQANLRVERIREPLPDRTTEGLFPASWAFPRFLAFAARKVATLS